MKRQAPHAGRRIRNKASTRIRRSARYKKRLGNMKKSSGQGSEDPILQWVTFRLDKKPTAST